MLCPKCQTENPEGSKFCGDCGTPLVTPAGEQLVSQPTVTTPQEAPKSNKSTLIIIGIAVFVFLLVVGSLLLLRRRFKKRRLLPSLPTPTPTTTPTSISTPTPTPIPTTAPLPTVPLLPTTPPMPTAPPMPTVPTLPPIPTIPGLQCYNECQSKGYTAGGSCFSEPCPIGFEDIGQAECTQGQRCCCIK